jgi:hypothetical protein
VVVDHRADLDLLDLDHFLLLARLVRLFLLLVFILAVVEDLAHGRIGVGRNLDEIEPGLLGALERLADGDDADLAAVGVDQADLVGTDLFIDAGAVLVSRRLARVDRRSGDGAFSCRC